MESFEPLYMQIINDIKANIRDCKYQVNQRIPSETELIRIYGVSRITIRRAIQELVNEGYLTKIHGAGTFVRAPKYQRHVLGINSFTTDCLNNGIVPRTRVLLLNTVKATAYDAKMLRVVPGEKIIYLERLRYADDDPVIIERDYFPYRFSAMLGMKSASLRSVARLLEDRFNVNIGHFDAVIEIAMPYKQDAKRLKLLFNAPILLVHGCTCDTDNNPLYRSVQVFAGNKFKVNISQNASWGDLRAGAE